MASQTVSPSDALCSMTWRCKDHMVSLLTKGTIPKCTGSVQCVWKLQFSLKKNKDCPTLRKIYFFGLPERKSSHFFLLEKSRQLHAGSKLDYGLERKASGLDRKGAGLDRKAAGLVRKAAGLESKNAGFESKAMLCWPPESKLLSLPFQDPKKSRFSGPTPSNGPHIGFSRIRIIHYIPRHINNIGKLIVSFFFWSSYSTGPYTYNHVQKCIGNLFQFEEKPKSSWQYFYLW